MLFFFLFFFLELQGVATGLGLHRRVTTTIWVGWVKRKAASTAQGMRREVPLKYLNSFPKYVRGSVKGVSTAQEEISTLALHSSV